jgi:type II secretory pathway component PulJ
MKMKTKSRKGLTLIELVIAIATSVIVVLAAGTVIVAGQTSWNETWKSVNLQRDASYAMLRMSQSIKKAISATATADGPVLNIKIKDTTPPYTEHTIIFSYVADTNNLQYQKDGGQSQTIINGKVKNLQFNVVGNNTVTIDLSLKKDDAQAQFKSTVMMRNYGG